MFFVRSVILYIASSLDGYIAKLDGEVDWLFTDQGYGYDDFFARIDPVLMGRKTYSQVLEFGEYPYSSKQGFVLTRSPTHLPDPNVTFIYQDMVPFIESLRRSPGKAIWLVGGGEVIRLFLQHDWIDEIILSIHPVILGEGIPLFSPSPDSHRSLHLNGK